jgi:hypothetical protein
MNGPTQKGSINVGILVTLLLQLVFFVYSYGRLTQKVEDLQSQINRIEHALVNHFKGAQP